MQEKVGSNYEKPAIVGTQAKSIKSKFENLGHQQEEV